MFEVSCWRLVWGFEVLESDWNFASEVIHVGIDAAATLDNMLESIDPT